MDYRREIDGFRAIAVLPVMLFHAGFDWCPGGYLGVDVFFVISGYLITSIILHEIRAGTFSLLRFYERRARRILPALLLVMAISLPLSWHFMLPDDFENFGQSLAATALFGNNVLLWLTSGYFALANDFKPLMHTWSLGVEEQFYLLFPALVLALGGASRRRLVVAISGLAMLSLALAQRLGADAPIAAYLLLPTRVWQLMLGALAALLHIHGRADVASRPVVEALSLVGFGAVVAAFVLHSAESARLLVPALVAASGAILVILFASPSTMVGRFLASGWLVGLGLISYSAYLWHQPLFAFARLASLEEPSRWLFSGLIVTALALAALTWRFVERPFRNRQTIAAKPALLSIGILSSTLAGIGIAIHANAGFVRSWKELEVDIRSADLRLNSAFNRLPNAYKDLPFDAAATRRILVLGNSFARDFINTARENGYFSASSISYSEEMPACIGSGRAPSTPLRQRIAGADYVIFGSSPQSTECWPADLDALRAMGKAKVIVIGTKNFGWNNNGVMRLPPELRHAHRTRVLADVVSENQRLARAITDRHYVDMLAMLCDAEGRVPVFTDTGKFISQDTRHLTKDGARYVGKIIFEHPLLRELK